ncbi:MAG: 4Fe-4S binding protein, partial [Candidatus Coproplasma sp.]
VNKSKCIDCGLCASKCPAQNITKKGDKYHFGGHCTLCCRCTMNCPKDAISMGLLNGLRVNGAYSFEKLASDESVSGNYVNDKTKGYYKKFNKYYNKIDGELISLGLTPPRTLFEPDKYAVMTGKQKRAYKKEQAAKQG